LGQYVPYQQNYYADWLNLLLLSSYADNMRDDGGNLDVIVKSAEKGSIEVRPN
jgi:hypothetical protein